MTTKSITAIETAINDAATGWTGLDWTTVSPPSWAERRAVQHDAGVAADYGRKALGLATIGDWAGAVEQLEHAERIEREYGDSPMWRPVVELARNLSAVLTVGKEVIAGDFYGIVGFVDGDRVTVRWDDGGEGTVEYTALTAA